MKLFLFITLIGTCLATIGTITLTYVKTITLLQRLGTTPTTLCPHLPISLFNIALGFCTPIHPADMSRALYNIYLHLRIHDSEQAIIEMSNSLRDLRQELDEEGMWNMKIHVASWQWAVIESLLQISEWECEIVNGRGGCKDE